MACFSTFETNNGFLLFLCGFSFWARLCFCSRSLNKWSGPRGFFRLGPFPIYTFANCRTHFNLCESKGFTEITHFYVNETGVHTRIMGKPTSFNFLSVAKQKEVANLLSSSIYKQINTLQIKQNLIRSLQEEVS